MGQECLSEIPCNSPYRWKMEYDVANSLSANRLDEALDMAICIPAERGRIEAAQWMFGEIISTLHPQWDLDEKRLPVKEQALRAYLEVRPNHIGVMEQLGSILCKMQKVAEGKEFLERAAEDILVDTKKDRGVDTLVLKKDLTPQKKENMSALVRGVLVQVNGMTSPEGLALNGKYGIVRCPATKNGRLSVEMIAGNAEDKEDEVRFLDPEPLVSLKSSNLSAIDGGDGGPVIYRLLESYLANKTSHIVKKEGSCQGLFEAWDEIGNIPGFYPTHDQRAESAQLMQLGGMFDVVIRKGENILSEIPCPSLNYSKIVYQVATSLSEFNRTEY